MQLFLAEDGRAGVACYPGGDIESVFSSDAGGHVALELAVAAGGGRELDAFDTILAHFYAPQRSAPVSQRAWVDGEALVAKQSATLRRVGAQSRR